MTQADFQTCYGILPDCFLLTRLDGCVIAANEAVAGLLGRNLTFLHGAPLAELTQEPAGKVSLLLGLFSRSSHFLPGSLSFISKTGPAIKCRIEGARTNDIHGSALVLRLQRVDLAISRFRSLNERISALHREIMERKRVESQLQKSNENLRQFAYAVAHDLREPMRCVRLYSQLLARDHGTNLQGDGEMFVEQTNAAATRMEELLDGLLAFVTAGDLSNARFTRVDCNEIAAKAVVNLQALIHDTSARITWDTLPVLVDDSAALLTLFQNLFGNAIKYHRADEAPRVHMSASRDEGSWVLAVQDNGIGIEAEYHTRIFGLFKRLHPDKYAGTGIGLALCARIAESRGGRIWVESAPGEGARFCVAIPDG